MIYTTLNVGENAFLTKDDFYAYEDTRQNAPMTPPNFDTERAIVTATAIINRLAFKGRITSVFQPLAWPRVGVIDQEGRPIPSDSIPKFIKDATAELVLASYERDITKMEQVVSSRRIDNLQVAYEPTKADRLPFIVREILAPYLIAMRHSAQVIA